MLLNVNFFERIFDGITFLYIHIKSRSLPSELLRPLDTFATPHVISVNENSDQVELKLRIWLLQANIRYLCTLPLIGV